MNEEQARTMIFERGMVYRDAIGRRWKVIQVFHAYQGLGMKVRRAWRPWSET